MIDVNNLKIHLQDQICIKDHVKLLTFTIFNIQAFHYIIFGSFFRLYKNCFSPSVLVNLLSLHFFPNLNGLPFIYKTKGQGM